MQDISWKLKHLHGVLYRVVKDINVVVYDMKNSKVHKLYVEAFAKVTLDQAFSELQHKVTLINQLAPLSEEDNATVCELHRLGDLYSSGEVTIHTIGEAIRLETMKWWDEPAHEWLLETVDQEEGTDDEGFH